MKKTNLKKKKYILAGTGILLVATVAVTLPLVVKNGSSTEDNIFKRQIERAKNASSLFDSQKEIRKMYQYMSVKELSEKSKKAANALGAYIFKNKNIENFTFKYGIDKNNNNLELLIISNKKKKTLANNATPPKIYIYNTSTTTEPIQIPWVSKDLKEAKFGVLFGLYDKEVASQTTINSHFIAKDIKSNDFEKEKYTIYKIINNLQKTFLEQLTDKGNVKASQITQTTIKNLIKKIPSIKNAKNKDALIHVIDSSTLLFSLVHDKNSLKTIVSFDDQKLKETEFTIQGFKDENAPSNKEIVDDINNKQIESKFAIVPSKKTLPSTIMQPADETLEKNVIYTIKKWVQNDETGEIEWSVELKIDENFTKNLSGKISGFQTLNEIAELKLLNAKNDAIKQINDIKSSKTSMLATLETNASNPLTEKTAYTQSFAAAREAIKNVAKLEDVNKILNQEKDKIRNNYLIYDNAIKKANEVVLNNRSIKAVHDSLPDSANYVTNAEITTVANKKFVSGDLGIELLDFFGTTITYSHDKISKDDSFRINFVISKDSGQKLQKIVIVNVSGINRTKSLKIINDVKNDDLKLPNSDLNVLPSTKVKPNDGKTNSGVNYDFSKWKTNNETGIIEWEVILSVREHNKPLRGKITGFKKLATVITEEIDNAKQKIDAYKSSKSHLLTPLDSGATKPLLEKNKYKKGFEDAEIELDKVRALVDVDVIFSREITKIDQLYTEYDSAIKKANFAFKKSHIKTILINYWNDYNKSKTTLLSGAHIFPGTQEAWELAKTAALNNVDNASTDFVVLSTNTTQTKNIETAFNVYEDAIKNANKNFTQQQLDLAKNAAIREIDDLKNENTRKLTSLKTEAILPLEAKIAYEKAFDDAKTAIDSSETPQAITKIINQEIIKIKRLHQLYNSAILNANLVYTKKTEIVNINKIKMPIKDPVAHDITLLPGIITLQKNAVKAINNASSMNALNNTISSQKQLIHSAIADYNVSTGTELKHVLREIAKFNDAVSLKNDKSLLKIKERFLTKGKLVGAIIFGYVEPKLDSVDKKKYVIDKTYDATTKKLIVKVELTIGKTTKSKNITITAGKPSEIVKLAADFFTDRVSNKNKTELKSVLANKNIGDTLKLNDLGIIKSTSVNNSIVNVAYKIHGAYNNTKGTISISVEIRKDTAIFRKIITITASDA